MIVAKINDQEYAKRVKPFCNFEKGPWVAGGSVRKVYQGLNWLGQDIDFFFANSHQFEVMQNRVKSFGSLDGFFTTDNAVTYTFKSDTQPNESIFNLADLKQASEAKDKKLQVQLIKKSYFNDIEQLLNSFDIGLSQFATDGIHIFATEQAIEDLNQGIIRNSKYFTQLPNPNRVLKYSAYGFEPEYDLFKKTVNAILTHGVCDDSY